MKAVLHSNKVGDDESVDETAASFGGSNVQLYAIGKPIEAHGLLNEKRMAGIFSLRLIVPLAAVVVVVTIVMACLAPMTTLWVTSLKGLTATCTGSLSKEMDVYRNLLVDKSVESISAQMNIPPMVADALKVAVPEAAYTSTVPLHNDSSEFQLYYRGLAKQFSSISNLMAAWENSNGNHLYCDQQTYWCYHDSTVDTNVTYFWLDGDTPTTNPRGGDITNYNLTIRGWWKIGLKAWNGSWTSVYKSANPSEGRVMAYTIRPKFSVPVVVQITYTMAFLQNFFSNFNLTQNGLAFLAEDMTLKVIAATRGIPILTPAGGDVYATNCSNTTIVEAALKWLNLTGHEPAEQHFTILQDGGTSYVDVVPIKAKGGLVLWLYLITPEIDFMQDIQEEQTKSVDHAYFSLWVVLAVEIFIGLLSVIVSLTLALVLARALDDVISKLQKVSSGHLSKSMSTSDLKRSVLKEIDSLNSEVTIMQSALDSFSQYVPTQVVRYLCKNHMRPVVGVTAMHCTVMFLDVVDFTQSMEQYGAQEIIEILSVMFESFSTIITKNNGCIDKYIGDAIMALWGCPVADPNSEMNACKAVAEIQAELARLNAIFILKSKPSMRIRIGLHAGEVRAGNVGSSQRLNYTVLGNTVNLASRLEPLNKELLTSVLVSDSIRDACKDSSFAWRALGHIKVRGFKEPVRVHEFFGYSEQLKPEVKKRMEDYTHIDKLLQQTNKKGSKAATPGDVADAMDEYLNQNPDDFTIARAREVLLDLRSHNGSVARL